MADLSNPPRMPDSYHPLVNEIRELLQENPDMSRAEAKRRIMEARNLPIDMRNPFGDVRRPSYRGITDRRTMFNGRFNLAYRRVRPRR